MFRLRSSNAYDKLEPMICNEDEKVEILQHAPFYFHKNSGHKVLRKGFQRFRPDNLDPFHRFSLHVQSVSPAQLVFDDYNNETGRKLGNAFEAMIAFHAVHNMM